MTMHILVPHVRGKLRPETEAAVRASGYPVTFRAHDPDDLLDYARILFAWWLSPLDFCVVEGDKVPAVSQLDEMAACREGWCSIGYHVPHRWTVDGLGCVKFTAAMRARYPHSAVNIFATHGTGWQWRVWRGLDTYIHNHLTALGESLHVHPGEVLHLHNP